MILSFYVPEVSLRFSDNHFKEELKKIVDRNSTKNVIEKKVLSK